MEAERDSMRIDRLCLNPLTGFLVVSSEVFRSLCLEDYGGSTAISLSRCHYVSPETVPMHHKHVHPHPFYSTSHHSVQSSSIPSSSAAFAAVSASATKSAGTRACLFPDSLQTHVNSSSKSLSLLSSWTLWILPSVSEVSAG